MFIQYRCSVRLFTMVRRSSCCLIACWILQRTSSLATWSLYEMRTCGSSTFPWLVFFFAALLWGSIIHKHTGRWVWEGSTSVDLLNVTFHLGNNFNWYCTNDLWLLFWRTVMLNITSVSIITSLSNYSAGSELPLFLGKTTSDTQRRHQRISSTLLSASSDWLIDI